MFKLVSFLLAILVSAGANAQDQRLTASLDPSQATNVLEGDLSAARGWGGLTYDEATDTLSWEFSFSGLTGPLTAAHIHGPADVGVGAGVLIDLEANSNGLESPIIGSVVVNDPDVVMDLADEMTYVNLHTSVNGAGEIRGQLLQSVDFKRVSTLDPGQQTQAVNGDVSAALGSGGVTWDDATQTLSWSFYYEGLTGPVLMAHIHGPAPAGENAGVLIDLGANSPSLDSPIEGSVMVTDQLVVSNLASGATYVNLHTDANQPGEIRGQILAPTDFTGDARVEPEQATAPLNGDVSAAGGIGIVTYDAATDTLTWNVVYSGLTGPATNAHIHGPANFGANGGVLVDISGNGLDSPIAGSMQDVGAAALGHIFSGLTYINIHTGDNGPGEIRGQILPIVFVDGFESPPAP